MLFNVKFFGAFIFLVITTYYCLVLYSNAGEVIVSYDENKQVSPLANTANAYVTFLCDDEMAEATQVLLHALHEVRVKHDIVVLVLSAVTPMVRKRLAYLGAKVVEIQEIEYPFDSTSARRKGYNKACRYSKLHLWNLIDYNKVVFLDADTLVIQTLDELFDYPEFSATVDAGGVLNTGVFVAKPSASTFDSMMKNYALAPSYNRGDQGFLNWYFNETSHPIPGYYNVMIKFTQLSFLVSSYIDKKEAKVIHYTSEVKPWNFFYLQHKELKDNYDGYIFHLWTRTLRSMQEKLQQGNLLPIDDTWVNADRVHQVCDVSLQKNYGRRYPNKKQFTVILTLTKHSLEQLQTHRIFQLLGTSKTIHHLYIIADGSQAKLKTTNPKLPLSTELITFQHVSANNRMNPIQNIQTESVLFIDDTVVLDPLFSIKDLVFGFEAWKTHQDTIVGFYPVMQQKRYNMMRLKAAFMKSDMLLAYTCLLPQSIHKYVDEHPACLDAAVNMMVTGMTASKPLLIKSSLTIDPSPSTDQTQCIQGLKHLFNDQDLLTNNDGIMTQLS